MEVDDVSRDVRGLGAGRRAALVVLHLPLLATISCNADVIAALEPAASVA
jgi:hypothetical protein